MMRYIGMCLLFGAAAWICFVFDRRGRQCACHTEAILRFLTSLRRNIACYGKPLSSIAATYKDGVDSVLEDSGFLPALRDGKRLCEAMDVLKERRCLSPAMETVLSEFARTFGESYREDEVRTLDAVLAQAQTLFRSEEAARPDRMRLCRTLCLSLSLLVVLLFL